MVSMLWVAVAWGGACDRSGLQAISDALDAGVSDPVGLSSAGLAEACTGPAAMVSTAGQLVQVPPDFRPTLDLKLAADAPELWLAACPDAGIDVLITMAQVAPDAKRALVWNRCALSDRGWFTAEEWATADGTVVLALDAGQHLADAGVSASLVRTIVRGLAGVGGSGGGATPSLHDPMLELPELVSPQMLLLEESGGLMESGPATPPAFADRVRPDWSRKARKLTPAKCAVRIGVKPSGELRKVVFEDCPDELQADVQAAIEASTLTPATEAGVAVPGKFQATYKVR